MLIHNRYTLLHSVIPRYLHPVSIPLYPSSSDKTDAPLQYMHNSGWQKLAAFWRGQNWPQKFLSGAYLLFLRQMRCFAFDCKFVNSIQYNMPYGSCNSALLAQETLFMTQKGTFFCPKISKKCVNRNKSKFATKQRMLKIFV